MQVVLPYLPFSFSLMKSCHVIMLDTYNVLCKKHTNHRSFDEFAQHLQLPQPVGILELGGALCFPNAIALTAESTSECLVRVSWKDEKISRIK